MIIIIITDKIFSVTIVTILFSKSKTNENQNGDVDYDRKIGIITNNNSCDKKYMLIIMTKQ